MKSSVTWRILCFFSFFSSIFLLFRLKEDHLRQMNQNHSSCSPCIPPIARAKIKDTGDISKNKIQFVFNFHFTNKNIPFLYIVKTYLVFFNKHIHVDFNGIGMTVTLHKWHVVVNSTTTGWMLYVYINVINIVNNKTEQILLTLKLRIFLIVNSSI